MIDIANDNLDNELNIEKYNKLHEIMKTEIEKKLKEEFIKEGCNGITKLPKEFMINKNNPKYLEYWRNIFPTKTDNELEEYRVKWSKENPKYLKFERL